MQLKIKEQMTLHNLYFSGLKFLLRSGGAVFYETEG